MPSLPSFSELARDDDPPLDVLMLALAGELREVDAMAALAELDALGADLGERADGARTPADEARACVELLGDEHGFAGDRDQYDHPRNSMLDLVLSRRRGLPILLSVVYLEVARRAGIALRGVGLPGHFVVGHFGLAPPLLLDPFDGGGRIEPRAPHPLVRPWGAGEIAMRALNNLVPAYARRGNVAAAIHAADLRLELPVGRERRDALRAEARAMRARLN